MKARTKILYLVSLATFLRSFSQVIYTPSLVNMRQELATTTAMIGLTLSVYGLVLAFAQIAYGPVVDRFESKRILLAGVSLFSLASLAAFLSRGVWLLLLARGLQALGIAAAASVGVAMIADLFPQNERGRAMGVFEIFNAAGAAAGPVAGAGLALWLNWRVDFLALALVGLGLVLFSLWQVPAQPAHAQRVGLSDMLTILRTPATFGAIVLGLASFYGLYTIHTLLPVFLAEGFGLGEGRIGLMLTLLPIGVILASMLGGRAADHYGSRRILLLGTAGAVVTFSFLTILGALETTSISVSLVGFGVLAFGFANGFCLPVQLRVMVDVFPEMRGTAGALQYAARFAGATLAPALTGLLNDYLGLASGLGSATFFLAVGGLLAYFAVDRPALVTLAEGPD